jgi:hypothetical protein
MATFTIHQTGRADAPTVWRRYLHPRLWPTWSPQILSVQCADDTIRVGSTGVVHAVLGVRVPFEVTAVDPVAMRWSWIARLPLGIELRLTHTVDAVAFGTTTGLGVTGPAPVVLGYLPVAAVALRKLVRPEKS